MCEQKIVASKEKKTLYNHMKRKLKTRHYIPPLLQPNNEFTLDCHAKANLMNDTFAKVFLKNDSSANFPKLHTNTTHTNSSIFNTISQQEIFESIKETKSSVSQTPDCVPSLYVKNTFLQLLEPLQLLFNHSIKTSEIPSIWKTAIVIPIFKKGRTSDPGNYRPISLTSVICRILERIIHKHTLTHMIRNNLLSPGQHGFITGRSTQTQQLHFLNTLTEHHEKNQQTEVVYLDYSKAFDTVSHKKLLHILKHLKVNSSIIKWITNYLSNRTQKTLVDNTLSNSIEITSGVPQGSVLGPLLFVAYIDDLIKLITSTCHHTTVYAFADDIKLVSTDADNMQMALNVVSSWIKNWQLNLNAAKSEHLTLRQKNTVDLFINNQPIMNVCTVKDLGVLIASNFSWTGYINQIRAKANALSHNILRIFSTTNCWLLVNLFQTYVRPLLEYNTSSWSPHLQANIRAVESVQRTFTRRLCQRCNIPFTSYLDRLTKLNLESLEVRRCKQDLILLFKILHKLVDVDFDSFFQINNFSGYGLRRHQFHINRQKVAKTAARNNFFTYRVIKYWNMLPDNIVTSPTLQSFKFRLKRWDLKV